MVKQDGIQIIFPKLKSFPPFGTGNMHSKLQLLFHADYLRVVIPTVSPSHTSLIQGNLVSYDWGETGILENVSSFCRSISQSQSMYIQDFPRYSGSAPSLTDPLPRFASELLFFLKAQGISSHIVDKVREYDFSSSDGIEFVHSISGDHFDDLNRCGKNGLASAIERLGLKPSSQHEMLQLCYVVRNSIPQ